MKCLAAASLLFAVSAYSQDMEFVRMWEAAQRIRPATIPSVARIAAVNEPGTPLVIHGRVFKRDGVTPAPGVIIFAYQTDNTGVYNREGAPGWRLRGWAKSDVDGRFEFGTIRPGSYPGGRTPAHIHVSIEGPSLPRRWVSEIEFENDPYLTDAQRRASKGEGKFGSIRPVSVRAGVQHVDYNIRIADEGRF